MMTTVEQVCATRHDLAYSEDPDEELAPRKLSGGVRALFARTAVAVALVLAAAAVGTSAGVVANTLVGPAAPQPAVELPTSPAVFPPPPDLPAAPSSVPGLVP